jgi:hypothetical protein
MTSLSTATGWSNGSTAGEIKSDGSDHGNPNRDSTYTDRYSLGEVADGVPVQVYIARGGLDDPYVQVVRADGILVAEDDDGGDGYDAYLSWTYQSGDVIRATTYSTNASGTYTLYTDVGTVSTATDSLPLASDTSKTIDEDQNAILSREDFSAVFDNQGDGDGLYEIRITSLPANGSLTLNGSVVSVNQVIGASAANSDISGSTFKFIADANASGTNYASFDFQVSDGLNWSVGSYTFSLNVDAVNDDPAMTGLPSSVTVVEDITGQIDLSATTLGDVDAGDSVISLTIAANDGTLNAHDESGVTVAGSGTSALTLSGSIVDINTYLDTALALQYTGATDASGSSASLLTLTANDGGNTGSGGGGDAALGTVTIDITPVNDAPTVSGASVTTAEDVAHVFALSDFGFSDVDNDDTLAQVRIDSLPLHGGLTLEGNLIEAGEVIAAVDVPTLRYAPNANDNGVDGFAFSVHDGTTWSSATANLALTVNAVNDAPQLDTNAGASVQVDRSVTITSLTLSASDVDDASNELIYTVTTLPDSGDLLLNGTALAVNDTFTQADLDAAKVSYRAGNVSGEQRFSFVLADGGEDGVAPMMEQQFTFTVERAPLSPSPAPDPIQVKPTTPDEPQPDTPSGRPSVSETITNTGSRSGTAKLVENTGNANEVTATLPGGVSLINQGARTATNSEQALADLIGSIDAQQPGNLNDQTNVAGQWLSSRPDGALLDIRTLVLGDNGSASTRTPIQITGITDDGTESGARQEAFVIDVSSLPSGNMIQLDNIDFASIVGATIISGGVGDNVVIGDDAAQTIVLGPGDDELHGGGGDDTIGSEGGDDRLFGNSGNDLLFGGAGADLLHGGADTDTARYDGNRDDYVVIQEHGVITVQSKNDTSDIDTLVNIEILSFADGEENLSYDEDLSWMTGLYDQVLGRQADVSGVQYWAQRQTEGLSKADMAMLFITSSEAGQRLDIQGDGIDTVLDTLSDSLLGRAADAPGKAYWTSKLESGVSLRDVVGGFMESEEIRTHDMTATQWEFIA